ncbi:MULTISPECIES: hypothetical protein [Herpetosiphon]|uniref:hypothetical protein n=1 Tax=Herpetosiphon TaxID=64 RepID=UPI0006C8F17A|nr:MULTISPECIES: hypothetical protein [Herpetosiphon]
MDWSNFFRAVGWTIAIAGGLGLLGLALIWYRLKRLNVPEGASYRETMMRVPLSLVIVLDLLDLAFDVFAAPISWLVLSHFNLQGLRRVSVVEALIPGTQVIPWMTVSWFAVRLFDRHSQPDESVEP